MRRRREERGNKIKEKEEGELEWSDRKRWRKKGGRKEVIRKRRGRKG